MTSGWGHFHVSDALYAKLRTFLSMKKHPYATDNRFGDGPNWRLRTTRVALELLGFHGNLLCHGVKRELFACQLATNALEFLRGEDATPSYEDLLPFEDVANRALKRWVLPRAERNPEYTSWKRDDTITSVFQGTPLQDVPPIEHRGTSTLIAVRGVS